MKRLRVDHWSSRLLAVRSGGATSTPVRTLAPPEQLCLSIRRQSTATAAAHEPLYEDGTDHKRFPPLERIPASAASYPSPLPERALESAKLAALHARLSLSDRIPLQTLARTLVDASADPNPQFNNANLAFLGHTHINYHVAEWLISRYPRLPMGIFYSAMSAYAGSKALHQTARSWGIEAAAVPGGEVDPGLLQFSVHKPGTAVGVLGYRRTESHHIKKYKFRRGMSSRVVFDDDFGEEMAPAAVEGANETDAETQDQQQQQDPSLTAYGTVETQALAEAAYANAVRAVAGAVYAHCGREAVKSFVRAHVFSRTLDMARLFSFSMPTRELAMLCAREGFEPPVARLLSETGRLSRTPVYVVGIFSGRDKLGEGAGANLDHARNKAAMNCLKAWYLYSPGENVRVPSDMLLEGAKPWEAPYIDMGEVISH